MLSSRIAVIGAGVGLAVLVWLVWAAFPPRPANPPPSEATVPPPNEPRSRPDGASAETEQAPPTVPAERPSSAARSETTIFIRRYPKEGEPENRGDAVRVRLDLDRLRAEGLAMDDLMKAFEGCSVIDAHAPPRPNPPPGVLYEASLARPEVYGMLILKVTPEEGIVRLKDVATVELVADREAQETEVVAAPGGGRR
jgi:hypothetical protein